MALCSPSCETGRNPAEITRSIVLPVVCYDRPQHTRHTIRAALDGGFSHTVLELGAPYPTGVARWVADTVIVPLADEITAPEPRNRRWPGNTHRSTRNSPQC
ncbi:hypothetical protein [Streptomyces sp. NPDC001508]|uniref:hypothetical protein n=1 Tax=Streptomyces sp. NPDC001508 TaxID=3154656 RepID=UPI0033259B2C